MITELLTSMPVVTLLFTFGLGAIIGSFLNVYIYRFHTKRSLNGSSHCMSCGVPLKAIDLVPIVSYLVLHGRCRSCGCRFTPRYLLVELGTGLLFVAAVLTRMSDLDIVLLWLLLAVLMVIFVYDIRHYIIPDKLTLVALLLTIGLTAPRVFTEAAGMRFGVDVLVALAGAAFLFMLWFISKGQWLGFGDVKLAVPLGLLVGANSVFSFIVVSFWVGAGVSLLLLGAARLQRGQLALRFFPAGLTIKSVVPFAPFLIMGCLIVYFTALDVLTLFTI